jgi:hypothetical protein
MGPPADEVNVVEGHATGVGLIDAAHQIEQGRFARPIRSDDGKNNAAGDVQRNIAHRLNPAEALVEPLGAKDN